MEYKNKLNPEHSLRTAKGIKGTRQKVIVTHNPSEIDENQLLLYGGPVLSGTFCNLNTIFILKLNSNSVSNNNFTFKLVLIFNSEVKINFNFNYKINSKVKMYF